MDIVGKFYQLTVHYLWHDSDTFKTFVKFGSENASIVRNYQNRSLAQMRQNLTSRAIPLRLLLIRNAQFG